MKGGIMPKLDRRSFLKLVGQGSAALGVAGVGGLKFVGNARAAASGGASAKKASGSYWDEWEFYYPGKYTPEDAKVLQALKAELDAINNKGDVNISDLISGKLDGKPGIGTHRSGGGARMTADNMSTYARRYGALNPLFTDPGYAGNTAWGAMALPFAVAEPNFMPAMPKAEGFGDYMVVSAHNDTMNYYKPVYEGDTLYTVIDEQHFEDITPAAGSHYRTFTMKGWARVFNQKGELVAEGANILKESFRRHRDPAERNRNGAHAWESPNWWSRKPYIYSDGDWEEIREIWKNEKIRGGEVLYWDDVNIGDMPPARAVGPIRTEEKTDMIFDIPDWSTDAKLDYLDPDVFKTMVKNEQGFYLRPEYLEKKPPSRAMPVDPDATPEIAHRDDRGLIQNAVAAKWAAGMIFNWMGDAGWLQRIGWDIMELPPGPDDLIDYTEAHTLIPDLSPEMRPALFDKYPYMDKVPVLRGCRAAWHAMEGDVVISRAYVTDKYEKGGEYFVDLTFWCETYDRYLVEEGFATVKLPKKA
jgi:acyl dehydratase